VRRLPPPSGQEPIQSQPKVKKKQTSTQTTQRGGVKITRRGRPVAAETHGTGRRTDPSISRKRGYGYPANRYEDRHGRGGFGNDNYHAGYRGAVAARPGGYRGRWRTGNRWFN
jgi:hypothetical protein